MADTQFENPMVHANFMALYVIEGEILTSEVCGNRDSLHFCFCDLDLGPMTFIYELDPYFLDIHRMCKYKLSMSRL